MLLVRVVRRTLAVFLALAGIATAQTSANLPPRRRAPLLAWLGAGRYAVDYTPEPDVHPSAGPHGGNVRIWYSPVLVEDLRAGRTAFRKGAAMVKELYRGGRNEVVGFAVMRKVRPRSGPAGRGWLFYETLDASGTIAIFGRGHPTCTGCHRQGVDYLQSSFRP